MSVAALALAILIGLLINQIQRYLDRTYGEMYFIDRVTEFVRPRRWIVLLVLNVTLRLLCAALLFLVAFGSDRSSAAGTDSFWGDDPISRFFYHARFLFFIAGALYAIVSLLKFRADLERSRKPVAGGDEQRP